MSSAHIPPKTQSTPSLAGSAGRRAPSQAVAQADAALSKHYASAAHRCGLPDDVLPEAMSGCIRAPRLDLECPAGAQLVEAIGTPGLLGALQGSRHVHGREALTHVTLPSRRVDEATLSAAVREVGAMQALQSVDVLNAHGVLDLSAAHGLKSVYVNAQGLLHLVLPASAELNFERMAGVEPGSTVTFVDSDGRRNVAAIEQDIDGVPYLGARRAVASRAEEQGAAGPAAPRAAPAASVAVAASAGAPRAVATPVVESKAPPGGAAMTPDAARAYAGTVSSMAFDLAFASLPPARLKATLVMLASGSPEDHLLGLKLAMHLTRFTSWELSGHHMAHARAQRDALNSLGSQFLATFHARLGIPCDATKQPTPAGQGLRMALLTHGLDAAEVAVAQLGVDRERAQADAAAVVEAAATAAAGGTPRGFFARLLDRARRS